MPGADAGRAASDMVGDAGGRGEGGGRRARRLCKGREREHERSHKKRIEGIFWVRSTEQARSKQS